MIFSKSKKSIFSANGGYEKGKLKINHILTSILMITDINIRLKLDLHQNINFNLQELLNVLLTFFISNIGTLFLSNISDMPPSFLA